MADIDETTITSLKSPQIARLLAAAEVRQLRLETEAAAARKAVADYRRELGMEVAETPDYALFPVIKASHDARGVEIERLRAALAAVEDERNAYHPLICATLDPLPADPHDRVQAWLEQERRGLSDHLQAIETLRERAAAAERERDAERRRRAAEEEHAEHIRQEYVEAKGALDAERQRREEAEQSEEAAHADFARLCADAHLLADMGEVAVEALALVSVDAALFESQRDNWLEGFRAMQEMRNDARRWSALWKKAAREYRRDLKSAAHRRAEAVKIGLDLMQSQPGDTSLLSPRMPNYPLRRPGVEHERTSVINDPEDTLTLRTPATIADGDIEDWDFVITPPHPIASGKITADLNYAGVSEPLPIDDPRNDQSACALKHILGPGLT